MKFSTSFIILAFTGTITALPAFPTSLFTRQRSSTRNDLTDGSPCKDLTVIYARGTSEGGNVGSVAGPPFFSALASSLGASKVDVQGVAYNADWSGAFAGGDAQGSTTMANLVNQASTQCPETKIVMSGYSQGAQLVHNAAKKLSASVVAKISSVVVFGDPYNGQPVGSIPASKVKSFCRSGDSVCERGGRGGGGFGGAHLQYGQDASAAASFVVSQSGLHSA